MTNNQIASILIIVLGVMITILLVLVVTYVFIKLKANKKENVNNNNNNNENEKTKVQQLYNIQSVFNFMEFDKIEDNMIVQKNGKRFLMVVKCQGINFDLMSAVEKNSVEQGFIQYLNTLRNPI